MEYVYVRVSSREQKTDRQLAVVGDVVKEKRNIFVDKQSGKDIERAAYKRLIGRLKAGDVIFVKAIDRLDRDYEEILEQWRIITKVKGADICVLDFPLLDTRKKCDGNLTGTFVADMVLQILSYVAQTEHEFIHQRQAEGIAAAKTKGIKFGRPKTVLPPQFEEIAALYNKGTIFLSAAAAKLGMNRSTFYRYAIRQSKK